MAQVKNWTVEKKDEIEHILIDMWAQQGMDVPENFEDIVQFCYEDICETADPIHWSNADVSIAFRRWIEAQAPENVQISTGLKDSKGDPIMLGSVLQTVGELRYLMEELDDSDQVCVESCDTETGDVEDLFPMTLDVIDGIELTDGSNVREVRFCQRPNSAPDTREKQPVVDALIDVLAEDIAKGDTTVLDELLLRMPYDVLKYALPEDMWADFEDRV